MAEVVDLNQHRNRPKAASPPVHSNAAIGLAIRLDSLRGPAEEEIPNLLLALPPGMPIPKRLLREFAQQIIELVEWDEVYLVTPDLDDDEMMQVK